MHTPVLLLCLLCLAASVTAKLKGKSPDERNGLLLLDSVTFPRIVPNANRSVVLFVWPQVDGDYGVDSLREDYYNFVESAEYQGNADNVLFAQMVLDLVGAKPFYAMVFSDLFFLNCTLTSHSLAYLPTNINRTRRGTTGWPSPGTPPCR